MPYLQLDLPGTYQPDVKRRVAGRLGALMDSPDQLRIAAEAARSQGRLDAAERLADAVERVAGL